MSLEQITETQYAALARRKRRDNSAVALKAMEKFYSQYELADRNLAEDPVMALAFAQATRGANRNQGITNQGISEAIDIYGQRYDEYFNATSLEDIRHSFINLEFEDFPDGLDEYINRHRNMTFEELSQAAEEREGEEVDEDARRALIAIKALENYKFEAKLYAEVIREITEDTLQALYRSEEQE